MYVSTLPVLIYICVFILPLIQSQKSKHKSSEEPDWDTCDFQGYDGPEDGGNKHRKKNKVRLEVRGPVAALFTPFTEDGEINYSVIPKYIKYLNKTGATAIGLTGWVGEGPKLTICERKTFTEAVVYEAKKYSIKIIVQIGGAAMQDVIALARHAEKLKVAGILVLPPLLYKPKRIEDLIWYLSIISKFAPSLPLLYYHDPDQTKVYIKDIREFHTKLSIQIVNYKGMLTTFLVALDIADLVRRDQEIFIYSHHVASPALMGFDSSTSPAHTATLEPFYEILKAIKTGDIRKAKKLQSLLDKIYAELDAVGETIPVHKATTEIATGIKLGPVRPPEPPITDEQRKCITEILQKYGIQTFDN